MVLGLDKTWYEQCQNVVMVAHPQGVLEKEIIQHTHMPDSNQDVPRHTVG